MCRHLGDSSRFWDKYLLDKGYCEWMLDYVSSCQCDECHMDFCLFTRLLRRCQYKFGNSDSYRDITLGDGRLTLKLCHAMDKSKRFLYSPTTRKGIYLCTLSWDCPLSDWRGECNSCCSNKEKISRLLARENGILPYYGQWDNS